MSVSDDLNAAELTTILVPTVSAVLILIVVLFVIIIWFYRKSERKKVLIENGNRYGTFNCSSDHI